MIALRFSQILLLVIDVGRMCRKRLLEEDLSSPDSCNRQNLCKRDVRQAGQERKRLVWVICAPLLMEHKEDFPRILSRVREDLRAKRQGKDSNLQILFGDGQLTPSPSLHRSPHSLPRNTCRPMLS